MTGAAISVYEANAADMIARFDGMRSEEVLAPILPDLPAQPSRILDIGAGPGRDARWLADRGHLMTAAEPVAAFREHGARLGKVDWIDSSLPDLVGLEVSFDVILGVAVWHHLGPGDRDRAYARLAQLLAPDGKLILSLRQGPLPEIGGVFDVPPVPEAARAALAGWRLDRMQDGGAVQTGNRMAGVSFTWVVFTKGEADA